MPTPFFQSPWEDMLLPGGPDVEGSIGPFAPQLKLNPGDPYSLAADAMAAQQERAAALKANGPEGYNGRPDILELRGNHPSYSSGYGAGVASNQRQGQQNVYNNEARTRRMSAEADMARAKAAQSAADTERQALTDPLMQAIRVLKDGLVPWQRVGAFISQFGGGGGNRPGVLSPDVANMVAPESTLTPTQAINQTADRGLVGPDQQSEFLKSMTERYGNTALDQIENPGLMTRAMEAPFFGHESERARASKELQRLKKKPGVQVKPQPSVGVPSSGIDATMKLFGY